MEYDWDSVQVGRPQLNSSQNFFRKCLKHWNFENFRKNKFKFFSKGIRHVLHEKEGAKLKGKQDIISQSGFVNNYLSQIDAHVHTQQGQKNVAPNVNAINAIPGQTTTSGKRNKICDFGFFSCQHIIFEYDLHIIPV